MKAFAGCFRPLSVLEEDDEVSPLAKRVDEAFLSFDSRMASAWLARSALCWRHRFLERSFTWWQRLGPHVTPAHFRRIDRR